MLLVVEKHCPIPRIKNEPSRTEFACALCVCMQKNEEFVPKFDGKSGRETIRHETLIIAANKLNVLYLSVCILLHYYIFSSRFFFEQTVTVLRSSKSCCLFRCEFFHGGSSLEVAPFLFISISILVISGLCVRWKCRDHFWRDLMMMMLMMCTLYKHFIQWPVLCHCIQIRAQVSKGRLVQKEWRGQS